ncbi:MAG: hypothetical protein GY861_27000 [bacterium]|nr:hypothetical protein [bacterium]
MKLTDREMLIWFHERLVHVHGEDELVDYMHRLRDIIKTTDKYKRSEPQQSNSLEQMLEEEEE